MTFWFFMFILENFILVCLILACFFGILYDWRVERRNKVIEVKADLYSKFGKDLIDKIDTITK